MLGERVCGSSQDQSPTRTWEPRQKVLLKSHQLQEAPSPPPWCLQCLTSSPYPKHTHTHCLLHTRQSLIRLCPTVPFSWFQSVGPISRRDSGSRHAHSQSSLVPSPDKTVNRCPHCPTPPPQAKSAMEELDSSHQSSTDL